MESYALGNDSNPRVILVLSGKRKSGKDFVANALSEKIGPQRCAIIRLSAPLKKQYAVEHNLNYEELLEASKYKETYRLDMIRWGEEQRNKDPGYFCRSAITQSGASMKPTWIVSDARRITDINYFLENYPHSTHTVRICASEETRRKRGWEFTEGVDDAESECGLDSYNQWNFIVRNDSDLELWESIKPLLDLAEKVL